MIQNADFFIPFRGAVEDDFVCHGIGSLPTHEVVCSRFISKLNVIRILVIV
jgi:hypothetical protein